MKQLTKAEELVMRKLWELKSAFLRELVEAMPEPKPHQNTVATVLKILTEKGFVGVKPFGRIHRYYPLMKQSDYSKKTIKNVVQKYFNGSFKNVVSTMVQEKNISIDELESLINELKNRK